MRPTLISAVIGLLAAAGIGAGTLWWTSGTFDPATCSDQWLWIWLVSHDVAELSNDISDDLIERLEAEILEGIEFPDEINTISEKQAHRLATNIDHLQERWFRTSVASYVNTDQPTAKLKLIDRKLSVLMNWPETPASGDSSPSAADMFGKIKSWITAAEQPEKDQMNRAVQSSVERWLQNYDLHDQPASVQHELTRRIADELNGGLKLSSISESDSGELFQGNARLLMKTWFQLQAAEYAACDSEIRKQLVDQRLDELLSWNLDELLADESPRTSSAATQVLAQIEQWIQEAPAGQRDQLREFASAAQSRMMMRLFSLDGPKK